MFVKRLCELAARKEALKYPEFRQRVEEQITTTQPAAETQRAAEQAITATLETLSERLTGGEATDLTAQLPQEIQAPLERSAEEAESFSVEEFCQRVADREGVDIDTARNDASAVMTVLRVAVTSAQLEDLMSQLPSEFNVLFR